MSSWYLYGSLALVVGSLVCLGSFIASRKPDAQKYLSMIAPYQGSLGVAMFGYGIWQLVVNMGDFGDLFKHFMIIWPLGWVGYMVCNIILGFMLGFGLIAKWIPGEGNAEKKAVEIQKKLLGYATPIGFIGLACGVITLISYFHTPTPH